MSKLDTTQNYDTVIFKNHYKSVQLQDSTE